VGVQGIAEDTICGGWTDFSGVSGPSVRDAMKGGNRSAIPYNVRFKNRISQGERGVRVQRGLSRGNRILTGAFSFNKLREVKTSCRNQKAGRKKVVTEVRSRVTTSTPAQRGSASARPTTDGVSWSRGEDPHGRVGWPASRGEGCAYYRGGRGNPG